MVSQHKTQIDDTRKRLAKQEWLGYRGVLHDDGAACRRAGSPDDRQTRRCCCSVSGRGSKAGRWAARFGMAHWNSTFLDNVRPPSRPLGAAGGRWGPDHSPSPCKERARGPCGPGRAVSALWSRGPKRPWSGCRGHPGMERRLAVADALAGIPGRALGFDARRCTAAPCRRHPPGTAPVHEHDID